MSQQIDFLYLSEPDMIAAGVTDMAECVDTMTDMLALFARGDYRMAGTENNSHGAQTVSYTHLDVYKRQH